MRYLIIPLFTAAMILITAPAIADLGDQLIPYDGAAEEHFGVSVAISSAPGLNVAILEVYINEDNSSNYVGDALYAQPTELLVRRGTLYSKTVFCIRIRCAWCADR